MYNALCCSIFTPDLDVSGGVPGAKSGTAQAVPVVSPPTPLYTVASGPKNGGGGGGLERSLAPGHVLIFRHSSRFVLIFTIIVMRKSATHDPKSCVLRPVLATIVES